MQLPLLPLQHRCLRPSPPPCYGKKTGGAVADPSPAGVEEVAGGARLLYAGARVSAVRSRGEVGGREKGAGGREQVSSALVVAASRAG